tara:strand:+ start:1476 stop:1952 length:477 start_codon:yes stop_codon:yes gene_type:complete
VQFVNINKIKNNRKGKAMPRAFRDEDIVVVDYKTRTDYIKFLGKVVGYDSPNRKYIVHTFAHADGYHRVTKDLMLSCHKYELKLATGEDIDAMSKHQTYIINNLAKEWQPSLGYAPSERQEAGLAYTSFALQRIKDMNFNRNFTEVVAIERNRYVSWM